jgi:hypothetical protein
MVDIPPIDLEEVVQAVGPRGRSQDPRGNLWMVLSVRVPLVRRSARWGRFQLNLRTNNPALTLVVYPAGKLP